MVHDKVLDGAIAGALATVPMTAVLLTAQKAGLMGEVPPKHITRDVLRSAGMRHMNHKTWNTATAGLHFTYGTSVGAVYGWLAHQLRLPVPGIVQGVGFALAVWAASYMGWVPALDIMPSEVRRGKSWVVSNVASHIVYGVVLGAITDRETRKHLGRQVNGNK